MSNFQCPECGMINIDCGLGVFKTPREIELEKENEILNKKLKIAEENKSRKAKNDNKLRKNKKYDIRGNGGVF